MKRSFVKPYPVGKTPESKLTAATLIKGWFQRRKDAVKILEDLTQGTIVLAEAGYRGHDRRHWVTHDRCGYSFLSSLKEISVTRAESCPYCNTDNVRDLGKFGTIQAMQDFITIIAAHRYSFLPDNRLGDIDDLYSFHCHIHRRPFLATFRSFLEAPEDACVDCLFDRLMKRSNEFEPEEDTEEGY